MSGFDLVPVDGGTRIHLPPGESVLGRGPLLGVSDKRVSRHHGLLENQDGRLRLKPTHVNPCFVQSSISDDPRPLKKDAWHLLQHGDVFSLLPGQLLFQVESVGAEDAELSDKLEEEEVPVSPEPDVEATPAGSNVAAERRSVSAEPLTCSVPQPQEVEDVQRDDESPAPRRRVLPAWMTSASPQGVKRCKEPTAATRRATPNTSSSPEEVELNEEEEKPRKKRRIHKAAASSETDNPGTTVDAAASGKESRARRRKACPYGADCYRRNPAHFLESSHPGDSDYEEEKEEEEEEEAERPECPYGTDCYRKNPLHRKEFKHTRRPARATRAAPRKSPAEDDDNDDDSFINDDSEDAGDDSDYAPPDSSDDDGGEDLRALQKEARAFVKRRK